MKQIRSPWPKQGSAPQVVAALLSLVLIVGFLAVAAPAQTGDSANDVYGDPLAYARINPTAESIPLSIKYRATGETRRAMGRYLLTDSQEMYLRSESLATILKAGRYWQGELRQMDLKVGAKSFRVTAGSRVVVTEDGEMLMPVPVLDHEGDLWLPMVFLEQVVGPQTRERVAWNPEDRQLVLGSADYSVARLEVEVLGRTTAVHIFCREPLGYRTSSPRSGVIDLKIYGGEVNTSTVSSGNRRGLARSVSSHQFRDHAKVTINVDQLVGRYRTYTADEGREIVVVLEEEQVSSMPDPVPRGHANVNIEQGPVDVTNRIDVQTVVVDAGHGGHDVGAVSRRGIMEKDVNLGVATELRRYLEKESDLKVVLTRDNDSYLELPDRAEIANSSGGDLFLSLHCNSWFNDGAHGLETYFLSPAQSDWAKSVEASENQAGRPTGPDGDPGDVEFIVWELVQNRFISSSSQLAETIQSEVTKDLGLPNRGVRQAGFRVLVGAYMPAVLIELGFLSHAQEEQRLGDRAYQRDLARAIGDAVLNYRAQTGSGQEVADD
jgi:N-acetylmuramoyl-L-alanine amidase